jgi:DNA-binding Xre family transcriptional regulator
MSQPGNRAYIRGMPAPGTEGVYTARGHVEGEDWAAVATAVNARMAQLRIGQQDLANRSGVSVSTLRQVQHGAGRRVQNKTLTAIARALDWPDDHLADVLLNRIDASTTSSAEDVPAPLLAALHELAEGMREISQRLAAVERGVSRLCAAPTQEQQRPGIR